MENKKMLPDCCIWDFNGTILDDVETGIRAVNELLRERCLPLILNKSAYQAVFGFPLRAYYERLGFDFEKEPYEVVAPLWVELYLRYVKEATAYDDVWETLEFFRERGVRQIVLSATESSMLREQLTDLGLIGFFDEILGLDNIHAASKTALAQEWKHRNPHVRSLLLGDTDHDFEVAETLGAECILIARGHQSAERLSTLGVPVLNRLSEVTKLFADHEKEK